MSYLFPSSTITFEAALRDLASGSPRARAFAAHALGDVTDSAEKRRAGDALIAALDDDRPEVRAEACSSLGGLADPAALAMLIRRLDDGAPAVRQNAAIALGAIADPRGFEPLALALREGPADLRFQAATSLAEIDPKRAFDAVSAALDDRDPQVVGAAALALAAIPAMCDVPAPLVARARTALVERLDHPNDDARFEVAYALAELGDPAGRPVLVRAASVPERAWDAATALTTLGTAADAAALADVLADRKVPPEATVLAAGSLLRIGCDATAAARRVLLAGLAVRKTNVRGLAVEQLAVVGGDWAVPALEKLARSGKGAELLESIAGALRAIRERA